MRDLSSTPRTPVEVPLPGFTGRAAPGRRGWPARGWSRDIDGPRVVALGDSVTYGVGDVPGPNGDVGWAAHLAEALGASYYLNLSRMGARARTLTDEQVGRAVEAKPDVAAIIVGGNDVLRGDFDPREVYEHMARTITSLHSAGSEVVVVRLHDPRRTLPLPPALRNALGARIDRVNNALDAAVEACGHSAPVYLDAGADPQAYAPVTWHIDRMHPSPWGHRWLARRALDALHERGLLQQADLPGIEADLPTRAEKVAWLIREGTPWFLKRSIDLIPGALLLLTTEYLGKHRHVDLVEALRRDLAEADDAAWDAARRTEGS